MWGRGVPGGDGQINKAATESPVGRKADTVLGGWVPGVWVENPAASAPPSALCRAGKPGTHVQEVVEGAVGGLQVQQHLAHLVVLQLMGRRHAA